MYLKRALVLIPILLLILVSCAPKETLRRAELPPYEGRLLSRYSNSLSGSEMP